MAFNGGIMKIDEIGKQQAIEGNSDAGKKKCSQPDNAFANLLQDEISGVEETGTDPVANLSSIQNVLGIGMMPMDAELSGQVSAVEDTLSQLDSLKDTLQTSTSPKQADGIFDQINSTVADLQTKLSSLPEDHPLKAMADELDVTTYMESVKWKRGDYL
jgi:hypothetical protein